MIKLNLTSVVIRLFSIEENSASCYAHKLRVHFVLLATTTHNSTITTTPGI